MAPLGIWRALQHGPDSLACVSSPCKRKLSLALPVPKKNKCSTVSNVKADSFYCLFKELSRTEFPAEPLQEDQGERYDIPSVSANYMAIPARFLRMMGAFTGAEAKLAPEQLAAFLLLYDS